ncbi:efflux transporter outer membrane subunit [Oxalobacteraceae bacterium CAVE-383]|nr:efflux transporter outer membrane subunit [Oxalobacteraceae bacterium CAVE-383]
MLCALALGACTPLHAPYRSPAADAAIPARFAAADAHPKPNANANANANASPAAAPSSAERGGPWWRAFGDPQLDRLIDAALRSNNDLAAAAIRVRRAQLSAGIAAGNLLPRLGAGANLGVDRNLRGARDSSRSNSANASVSYELDLWGRLGSLDDAARWEALATAQDRESAALTLVGAAAGLYWQGAYLNQVIAIGEQSIAYAERTLALVQVQYRAGAVSQLELMEARQNVAGQRAAQTQLRQQQVENGNALAILFDRAPELPGRENLPPRLPDYPLPAVAADMPAAVLARRPDLRAAEQRLRGALANADATRAGYYPQFTLTGAIGGSSNALRNVLQNPVASLGLGLVLPFLNLNQARLDIAASQADAEFAAVNFRQSLYSALSDVENALSAHAQYRKQGILLTQRLDAARQAERLYEIRYRSGAVALSVFLDAQERRRNAEIAVAGNRLNALNNRMTLYLALGGAGINAGSSAG